MLSQANILISDTGVPCLADFGFSHAVNSSCDVIEVPNQRGMKGTIHWMAPEMFDGAEVSAEADVWAFGMTVLVCSFPIDIREAKQILQELFICKDPFYNIHPKASLFVLIIRGHLPDRPSDEDTHSRMTSIWWDICCRCWNRSPSSRPTMATLVDCIAEIVSSPLAAVFLFIYQPLQTNVSHSSIPNGALQMNGSVRLVLVHLVSIWHNFVGSLGQY